MHNHFIVLDKKVQKIEIYLLCFRFDAKLVTLEKFKSAFFNRCLDCESLQDIPFPDKKELKKLYENSWKSLVSAETGGVSNVGASFT